MARNNELTKRLAAFGLSPKDLSSGQLARARKDCKSGVTDGFFSSNELISMTLKRR